MAHVTFIFGYSRRRYVATPALEYEQPLVPVDLAERGAGVKHTKIPTVYAKIVYI